MAPVMVREVGLWEDSDSSTMEAFSVRQNPCGDES